MAEINLVIVPSLRSSAEKAADHIKNHHYDMIFLRYPGNLQFLISDYVSRKLSLHQMLDRIKVDKLLPESINAWFYVNEPILEAIGHLNKAFKVYCYGDVDYNHMLHEASCKIACLTARVASTDKIDIDEWMQALKACHINEALEFEAETVGVKAYGRCLCLAGLSGWRMVKPLKEMGHKVGFRCIEKLYIFKPLEVLNALLDVGKLTSEEAEKLISSHVNFVKNYVLTSANLDEAYRKWICDSKKAICHKNEVPTYIHQ